MEKCLFASFIKSTCRKKNTHTQAFILQLWCFFVRKWWNKTCPWQFFVTFLGWWKRDPFEGWNGDLQRLGIKRARLESPGQLLLVKRFKMCCRSNPGENGGVSTSSAVRRWIELEDFATAVEKIGGSIWRGRYPCIVLKNGTDLCTKIFRKYPQDSWDWNIYIHEWHIFMVNVG